uniref:Replication-associated protein n=1 Tax=Marmot associated feces virus 1 TaxID=2800896 RepID=A0A7T7DFU2_9VIRU|nr:replication associated protein [Marmot associated feces virus 1]QQL09574.1 replication associated protein [Marmot associated feces virus 1]
MSQPTISKSVDIFKKPNKKDNTIRSPRYRAWAGTVWLQEDLEYLMNEKYEYLHIGHEEKTEEGQIHYHVLIIFKNSRVKPRTINAHWEQCRNKVEYVKYCDKEGEAYFESGEYGINPANKDEWRSFVEECKIRTPRQLMESEYSRTYARYRGFAGEVHNIFREVGILEGDLKNEWWYGPAGTGKSRKAFTEYPKAYIKSLNKWWDGYSEQEVVIIDDWGPNQECLVDHLKHWADRYPFPAEIKGSSMKIRPKKIIVTSNYSIDSCFSREEDQEAIKRRFKVTRFHKPLGE